MPGFPSCRATHLLEYYNGNLYLYGGYAINKNNNSILNIMCFEDLTNIFSIRVL